MNPALSPQARVQISQLAQRLAAGEDPQGIIAEASALAGEVGQAGAAQDLQQRQLAFRQRRLGELEAEVESAVPAAAERIRNLAKEQGLNPAPYLQRLAQNIKERKLREQVLARQAAGPQGGLSLADLKLLFFTGQLDPSKLSDDQRRLIGLPPKEKAKFVAPPSRAQAEARIKQILALTDKILGLSEAGKLTADQEIKYQKELDQLGEEYNRLSAWLRQPRGR